LATLFAVTLAYSLLFGGMRLLGAPPVAIASVAVFITLVGLGQALLFRGKSPRAASVLVGCVTWFIGLLVFEFGTGIPRFVDMIAVVFGLAVCSAPQGALFGYVAGVFVGGVFLVADGLRRGLRRLTRPNPTASSKGPWDEP
jgi:hypothetical protein